MKFRKKKQIDDEVKEQKKNKFKKKIRKEKNKAYCVCGMSADCRISTSAKPFEAFNSTHNRHLYAHNKSMYTHTQCVRCVARCVAVWVWASGVFGVRGFCESRYVRFNLKIIFILHWLQSKALSSSAVEQTKQISRKANCCWCVCIMANTIRNGVWWTNRIVWRMKRRRKKKQKKKKELIIKKSGASIWLTPNWHEVERFGYVTRC